MIGLRVSAAMLRKIDKFADALSQNRTNTLRFLLTAGIEAKFYFLRRGRGSRMADRVARVAVADAKAKAQAWVLTVHACATRTGHPHAPEMMAD